MGGRPRAVSLVVDDVNKGTCARGGAEHRGWGVLSEPGSVDPEVGEQSVGLKERAPAGSEDA